MTDNELVLQMVIEIDKIIMDRQRDVIEELQARLRGLTYTSVIKMENGSRIMAISDAGLDALIRRAAKGDIHGKNDQSG